MVVNCETIRKVVEKRADEIVDWLMTAVRFPSENRPPDGNEGPFQEFIADECRKLELQVDIFSPEEVVQELLEKRSTNRKIPLKYGNRPGTNRKKHPMVKPGEKYNHASLRNACKRGCKRAGVEVFVPYDLRRSKATGVRSILGKEASKLLLGHANTDTTDIYLLEEVREVIKVAKLLDTKE